REHFPPLGHQNEKRRPIRSGVVHCSARERIRTSTPFPELPPQGSASANSATRAGGGGLLRPTGVSRAEENTRASFGVPVAGEIGPAGWKIDRAAVVSTFLSGYRVAFHA